MELACFHLSMPLLSKRLAADPLLMACCSLLTNPLSQSPHGFQPSSSGPRELGGGSSFCMPPEAEDESALQPAIWGLPP